MECMRWTYLLWDTGVRGEVFSEQQQEGPFCISLSSLYNRHPDQNNDLKLSIPYVSHIKLA